MSGILSTNNLSINFMEVKAVDNLTVSFPAGVATGLVGPNGCGKTTLFNLISGVLEPSSGTIRIRDRIFNKIDSKDLRKLKITRTFQDCRLINQLSVEDNIMLAISKTGIVESLMEVGITGYEDFLFNILKTIDLAHKRHELAENLSYGQRKLLEIGRALASNADIYLFDEPFSGLFPEIVEKIKSIIYELKNKNKTIILVEHNIAIIKEICDKVVVMDAGKLLMKGNPEIVFADEKVKHAYLGE
jgi:ABC-type branched-subunit amino acid transport system ATPase component